LACFPEWSGVSIATTVAPKSVNFRTSPLAFTQVNKVASRPFEVLPNEDSLTCASVFTSAQPDKGAESTTIAKADKAA